MKLLCIVMMIIMMTSCVSHHAIPENWKLPTPLEGEKCPDISGQYMNLGESIDKKSPIYLDREWYLWTNGKVTSADTRQIVIRQEESNQLKIVAMSDSGAIAAERLLKKESGDFSCQDGWLRISNITHFATSSAGVITNNINSFAKSGDYLLEKRETNSFGLILIIPAASSFTRWYRFSHIESRVDESPAH